MPRETIESLIRSLQRTEEYRNGAFRIDTSTGSIRLISTVDPRQTFTTIDDMRNSIESMGMTRNLSWQAGVEYPRISTARAPEMERLAELAESVYGPGARIDVTSFRPSDRTVEGMMDVLNRDGKNYGALAIRDYIAALRIFAPQGPAGDIAELERDEVYRFLRQDADWVLNDLQAKNLGKRITPLLTMRSYALTPGKNKLFKVGVYDAKERLEGGVWDAIVADIDNQKNLHNWSQERYIEELAAARKSLADGAIIGNRDLAKSMRRDKVAALKQARSDLANATSVPDRMEINRTIHILQREVDHLEGIVGGADIIPNSRIVGFHLSAVGLSDDPNDAVYFGDKKMTPLARFRELEQQQLTDGLEIKANMLWADPRLMIDPKTGQSYDFLVDVEGFAKGFGVNVPTATFDFFKEGLHDVTLDTQSLASHPELLGDVDEIIDYNKKIFQETMDELERTGKLPTRMRQSFEETVEMFQKSISSADIPREHSIRQFKHAQQILDFDDHYLLKDDPSMYNLALDTYKDSMVRRKGYGKGEVLLPKMILPNTTRGEVVASNVMRAKNQGVLTTRQAGYTPVKDGTITFKHGAVVLSDRDFVMHRAAFGGFDQDDALLNALHWDARTNSIKAIVNRQPNSRGEWAMFDVDATDEGFLKRVMKEQWDEYSTAMSSGDMARAQSIVSSRLRALPDLVHPSRPAVPGQIDVPRIQDPFKIYNAADGTYTYAGLSHSFVATDDEIRMARNLPKQASTRVVDMAADMETLNALSRLAAEDPAGMPKASIARMAWDHVLGANESELRAAGLFDRLNAKLIEYEVSIDAAVGGGKTGINLDDLNKEMYTQLGDVMVKANAKGHKVQFDPVYWDLLKMGSKEDFRDAFRAANAQQPLGSRVTPSQLIMEETDSRSYLGKMSDAVGTRMEKGGARGLRGDIVDKIEAVRATGYGDFIKDADVKMNRRLNNDVMGLFAAQREAYKRYTGLDIDEDFERALIGLQRSNQEVQDLANDHVLRYLSKFFEPDATGKLVWGNRGREVMTAAAQMISNAPKYKNYGLMRMMGTGLGVSDLFADTFRQNKQDWLQKKLSAIDPADQSIPSMFLRAAASTEIKRLEDDKQLIELQELHSSIDSVSPQHPTVRSLMDEVFQGTDTTYQQALDITKGVEASPGLNIENVPGAEGYFRQGFKIDQPQPFVRSHVPAPLSEELLINIPSEPNNIRNVGSVIREAMEPNVAPARRAELIEHLRAGIVGTTQGIRQLAESHTVPGTLQRYVDLAASRAPGADQQRLAAKALDAADAVAGGGYKRGAGEMMKRLWKEPLGRGGIYAASALAAVGIIQTVRDKDRTINEMQGPAFLPGGNPYDEENAPQFPAMDTPNFGGARSGGGTTYDVRLRGRQDSELVTQIASILGNDATIQSNQYDSRDRPRGGQYREAAERY